jgi:hypothetical protein
MDSAANSAQGEYPTMARMLMLSLSFLAAVALGNEAISQAPIDVPLVQDKPTLRSEIKRGVSAAGDCVKGILALDAMSDCIFKSWSDNRQTMGAGTDAFDLGLSFGGWLHATLSGEALAGTPDFAQQAQHVAMTEKIFWTTYVDIRKKVNLADDQVIEAAGLKAENLHAKVAAAATEYGD